MFPPCTHHGGAEMGGEVIGAYTDGYVYIYYIFTLLILNSNQIGDMCMLMCVCSRIPNISIDTNDHSLQIIIKHTDIILKIMKLLKENLYIIVSSYPHYYDTAFNQANTFCINLKTILKLILIIF